MIKKVIEPYFVICRSVSQLNSFLQPWALSSRISFSNAQELTIYFYNKSLQMVVSPRPIFCSKKKNKQTNKQTNLLLINLKTLSRERL